MWDMYIDYRIRPLACDFHIYFELQFPRFSLQWRINIWKASDTIKASNAKIKVGGEVRLGIFDVGFGLRFEVFADWEEGRSVGIAITIIDVFL